MPNAGAHGVPMRRSILRLVLMDGRPFPNSSMQPPLAQQPPRGARRSKPPNIADKRDAMRPRNERIGHLLFVLGEQGAILRKGRPRAKQCRMRAAERSGRNLARKSRLCDFIGAPPYSGSRKFSRMNFHSGAAARGNQLGSSKLETRMPTRSGLVETWT